MGDKRQDLGQILEVVTSARYFGDDISSGLSWYQGFFLPFWEGALGPFALGNFRYFNRNWENFFNHFYMIFLNRDPKTAFTVITPIPGYMLYFD